MGYIYFYHQMNQKFKNHLIPIFLFTSFFFLWDVSLNFISLNYFKGVTANYLIVFLLLPIFYLFVKERNISILRLFNQQKYITYLIIFIVAQFFLVNLLNNQIIEYYEIFNLFYFIILGIIYWHYRNFISENFEKILVLYLVIFICFSLFTFCAFNTSENVPSPFFETKRYLRMFSESCPAGLGVCCCGVCGLLLSCRLDLSMKVCWIRLGW